MSQHVLLIEDDDDVRSLVQRSLVGAGFRVTALPDGSRVQNILASGDVDVVVTDLTLPDCDGLALTRHIKEHHDVGILILSGRGDTTDRIIGLEIGADDYVAKPFEPRELVARVRSVLRRTDGRGQVSESRADEKVFSFSGWTLNTGSRDLRDPENSVIGLTSGEYKLLEALVTHSNRVLSRDQLLDLVSSNDAPAFDRSIDVRVGRLRKKLGDDSKMPTLIKTVRNGGYIFTARVMVV
jgi:two-component system OmpR family response regulator